MTVDRTEDVRRRWFGWEARGWVNRRNSAGGVQGYTDVFIVRGPTRRIAEWRRDGREARNERRVERHEWKDTVHG